MSKHPYTYDPISGVVKDGYFTLTDIEMAELVDKANAVPDLIEALIACKSAIWTHGRCECTYDLCDACRADDMARAALDKAGITTSKEE